MMRLSSLIIVLSILVHFSDSANILMIMIWPGRSHYLMLKPIAFELSRRGHNVTAITSFKEENHPRNYHQVLVGNKTVFENDDKSLVNPFDFATMSDEDRHNLLLWQGGLAITEAALQSSNVQNLLNGHYEFDIIISEQFYQEAFYILSHKYKAPLALVSTYGNCMRHSILTRSPLQLSTSFSEFLEVQDTNSFVSRLYNFYFTFYEYFWWNLSYMKKQELLVKKYIKNLSEPVPSLNEIQRNTSLFLMNRHFSFENPVAYLPNSVEIGGIHLSGGQSTGLPNDLHKILNNSANGVIYLSFGTTLHFSLLPVAKQKAFISVFRRVNQTVLLKLEDGILENKPENVITRKWFPQKEILAHPNVKVFIHHGGIFGIQEAATYGVPILGIPVFGDQYRNLIQVQHLGMGRILKYTEFNEERLEELLKDILENNIMYKFNAVEVSKRFHDRPMKPIDTAIYWIEYAIRHKNSDHMKNPAIEQTWIAYNLLDIVLLVIFIAFIFFYILSKFIQLTVNVRNDYVNKEKKIL